MGEGQVGVAVALAGITFVETQIRAGRAPRAEMLPTLPAILGNGVAGRVSRAGAGVDTGLIGRRVMTSLNGSGGYAEFAVANAAALIGVPDGVKLDTALAVLADGRTAVLLARAASIQPGETVLVEAAAGGVGSLLVQLAHNAGARVIAAAGGAGKLALASRLGAEQLVDYSQADWAQQLTRRTPGGVDVVFDGVGGAIGEAAFGVLRSGGRFCAFGMASGAFSGVDEASAHARGITLVRGPRADADQLRGAALEALAEVASGSLQPVVGQVFPLEDASAAHTAIEQRATLGKTLLSLGSVVD